MISTVNSNTNRVSGLASGLDTETLVKQLTSDIQSKIDSAKKQKILLEWKQDAYRDILNKLYDFNSKYFGSASGSIAIGKTLGGVAVSSSSGYVSVVAGTEAQSGSVYIQDIVSLATSAKVTSSSRCSPPLTLAVEAAGCPAWPENPSRHAGRGKQNDHLRRRPVQRRVGRPVRAPGAARRPFGSGRVSVSEADGVLTLEAEASTITVNSDPASDLSGILTFTDGASTVSARPPRSPPSRSRPSAEETVEFTINGKTFSFTGAATLSAVMNSINSSNIGVKISFSNVTDRFTLASTQTGAGSSVSYSDGAGSFLSSILGEGAFTPGTDAVVKMSLDGSTDGQNLVTVTRSSNTFTVDGITYTLNGMAAGAAEECVTVSASRNTDAIYKAITDFVEDYNSLLDTIHDKLIEKKYNNYLPLLDDEKEDLSDDEVEKWTDYAKSGLLRNDSTLTEIYNSLRRCMSTSISSLDGEGTIGVVLSDIGITTNSYTDYGQLTVDAEKLKSAIASDPDKVLSLLTQRSSVSYSMYNTAEKKTQRYNESGLLWRVNDIVKNNLSYIAKRAPWSHSSAAPIWITRA